MTPAQVFDITREETIARGGQLSIEAIDAARRTMDELAEAAKAALSLGARPSLQARKNAGARLQAAIDGYHGRGNGSERVVD